MYFNRCIHFNRLPLTYLYTLLYFTNITILGALGEVLLRIVFKHK
jgi:hypothetical protein